MTQPPNTLEVIDIPEHCGNAPRKAVLRDFLLALYQRDSEHVLELLKDDIRWDLLGSTELRGVDAVKTWLEGQPAVRALQLNTIITHGTDCGADGRIVRHDGEEIAFSHVVIFAGHAKSAKIKAIRSYVVELTDDQS